MRLLAALALFLSFAALAAPERIELWPRVTVLPDPAGSLTVEQVQASRDRFAAPQGAYGSLGMAKEVVWLRVALPADATGPWILDFDYALLRRVDCR
jgi:hypothetical protein